MRKISVGIIIFCLLISVYTVYAPEPERVIVVFTEATDVNLLTQYEANIEHVFEFIPAAVVTISPSAKQALSLDSHIEYIQTDYYRQYVSPPVSMSALSASLTPTSQVIPWGVDRIDADLAWSHSTGNGVRVGIIDTGIDRDHPDLVANIHGGFNTIAPTPQYPDPTDFEDDHGHGTHCAGIIGAVDNTFGVIGVAPDAWLYGIKAFDSSGSGYTSDCVEAIEWCIKNKMQVISMSWGSYYDDPVLHKICNVAEKYGIVLVAAAGNEGYYTPDMYPAAYSSVMAISATNSSDNVPWWSNYGTEIELAAPGVNIYSTYLGGGYAYMSGTSMACPHVSGTAALVIEVYPMWANITVRGILCKTAEDLGAPGWDPYYGYGLVDAEAAAWYY
jgi:subtilisin family serine protease